MQAAIIFSACWGRSFLQSFVLLGSPVDPSTLLCKLDEGARDALDGFAVACCVGWLCKGSVCVSRLRSVVCFFRLSSAANICRFV